MNSQGAIFLIPAYNEAESIGDLLDEARRDMPGLPVLVVSDGSSDDTAAIALERGAIVLDLPCNLGVGGAVQAGIRHARRMGFDTVVRIDGDGQHPPALAATLLAELDRTGTDLVIGSRFLKGYGGGSSSTQVRRLGNRVLALFLSAICRCPITDPTSGCWALRGRILDYFAWDFPCEYPEPEAIALARRQGYDVREVSIAARPRQHGASHITSAATLYFAARVALALVADRVRPIDRRFARGTRSERSLP